MALTAEMLPPHLRETFELRARDVEPRVAEQAIIWARRLYPALPERLRHVGPYQEATARLAGRAFNCDREARKQHLARRRLANDGVDPLDEYQFKIRRLARYINHVRRLDLGSRYDRGQRPRRLFERRGRSPPIARIPTSASC